MRNGNSTPSENNLSPPAGGRFPNLSRAVLKQHKNAGKSRPRKKSRVFLNDKKPQ